MGAEHEVDENSTQFAAPAKSAGGGGFNHADEVSAHFLAALLIGAPPFAPRLGSITSVEFEAKSSGWLIDDLLLTLSGADGARRCGISIKSNRQFAADGSAPADFVRDCWIQMLNGGPMQSDRDLLSLAVSGLPANLLDDLCTLRDLAEASDRDSLEQRLQIRGYADAGKGA